MHEEIRGSQPDECKVVETSDKEMQNNSCYQIINNQNHHLHLFSTWEGRDEACW